MAARSDIGFPYEVDADGRSGTVVYPEHVRELIEQVLFTSPGERVNRPTFGCGLNKLVFAPNSDAQATALQLTVPANLMQWLGELIEVQGVDVVNTDSTLDVTVRYVVRKTQTPQVAQFTRTV